MKSMERILAFLAISLLLTACGGGGSSTAAPATSGVAMPDKVSVVEE